MNPFGNLLVNLLMLALGLGSFKIAAEAIFRGVAQGASGATFPWATKPFGFMFVVGAWLGLGVLMLYAAWRGRGNPQDSDHDDERDHRLTEPQALRADQSQPTVPVVLEKQRGSMSSFDQFVQRAKLPRPLAHPYPSAQQHAAITSTQSKQRAPNSVQLPDPLHLYNSRIYAGLWLFGMTLYTVCAAFVSVFLVGVLGQKLAILLFALSFVIYLVIAVQCVRAWRWTSPALSLEKYGITDHFHGGRFIPWTDVRGVRLSSPSSTTSLVLQFARADLVRIHFGSLNLPFAAFQRIFYIGFEGRMRLTSLTFNRAQVMQVSQAFLRHSRR